MIGKVNTGSKSSGGLVPQIIVTAPQGSTITVDFDSYTLTGEETEHTFVVETGMHQIRGDFPNGKSKTEMVQVDKIAQFRIELDYRVWLYRNGDECTDVTGGWTADRAYTAGGWGISHNLTFNVDSMYMWVTTNGFDFVATQNLIDITPYSKICIERNGNIGADTIYIAFNPNSSGNWSAGDFVEHPSPSSTDFSTVSIDISHITGSRYVILEVGQGRGKYMNVRKVWLE